ncbi:MAG: universal stress protein [Flavobacteriales bacterium]
MKRILCPTDLSSTGDHAVDTAMALAMRTSVPLDLLHVVRHVDERPEAMTDLGQMAAVVRSKGVVCDGHVREGDIFHAIPVAVSEGGYDMMVLGTHGLRNLKQQLLGSDVLKLARKVKVPSIVVQELVAANGMERIVMPVAGHKDVHGLLDAVCAVAKAFGSEVHVFQAMRPMDQPSAQLLNNKRDMLYRLESEGIAHLEANVPPESFSVGYAKHIIGYAKKVGAGLIAVIADASPDMTHIADAEKERLLFNDAHIPVLCARDGSQVK